MAKARSRVTKSKRPRGRPAFEPTAEQRRLVETHAAFGTPQDDICTLIISPVTGKPITGKTLRDKFSFELRVADTRANARVAESLFYQAVGRPAQFKDGKKVREELKPAVAAAIWWTKARMGWKETSAHEHTGKNGAPIQSLVLDPEKLRGMDDDELAALERAIGKLQRGNGGGPGGAAPQGDANAYAGAIDGGEE